MLRRKLARKWIDWLPWAEYSYNTSQHSASKIIPFEAVYDIPPLSLLTYDPSTIGVDAINTYLSDRDTILRELHSNLLQAQDRMKSFANQHRLDIVFAVSNFVYLKL